MADLGMGSLMGGFGDIVMSFLKILGYIIPIAVAGIFMMAVWFFVQRKANFNIDVYTLILTANKGLVMDKDRGGITKMLTGGEELRLKRNKIGLSVPPADCWIPNLGKGVTLFFVKLGRLDFHPLSVKAMEKKGIMGAAKEKIENLTGNIPDNKFDRSKETNAKHLPLNIKKELEKVEMDIKPIPADIQSHMFLKADENVLKHQKINKVKEFLPLLGIVFAIGLVVFAIVWHYKYADILVEKNLNREADYIDDCKDLIREFGGGGGSPPPIQDIEGGGKPPPI